MLIVSDEMIADNVYKFLTAVFNGLQSAETAGDTMLIAGAALIFLGFVLFCLGVIFKKPKGKIVMEDMLAADEPDGLDPGRAAAEIGTLYPNSGVPIDEFSPAEQKMHENPCPAGKKINELKKVLNKKDKKKKELLEKLLRLECRRLKDACRNYGEIQVEKIEEIISANARCGAYDKY